MNENNENAIKGFETIPTLPDGMSFIARNGLISRVEQNCSHKGLTHNKWVKRIEGEATENKNIRTLIGCQA